MRRFLLVLVFIGFLAVFAGVQTATAAPANPLGLYYDNSFTNIDDYAHPGALLVAGNCNRYDGRFEKAREAGAEVIAYLNIIEVYDHVPCRLNAGFYMGAREHVPLWPYPKYGERINWPRTHLADMRKGSEWSNNVVDYVSGLMREGKVDGVFLDNVGARLWSDLARWNDWPQSERDEWTEGNIDLVRRLDAARREINPKFLLINNNLWDLGHGDKRGFEGEKYVDGVVLEHPELNAYHEKYAGREFASEGHRRVLVIARSPEDAVAWSEVRGVTHVTWQPKYDHPGKPLVPFTKELAWP
ncbi:MAG TPA: hypothetical protein VMF52_08960 [Steroidobacteraceae bacterium]|nr:hypothetical protein [Steroidobacteraceae bacterium]